jgi:hypothetical protein
VITVGLLAPAVLVQRAQPLVNGLASHNGCNARPGVSGAATMAHTALTLLLKPWKKGCSA